MLHPSLEASPPDAPVRLDHRVVASAAGPEAESFLNGLLTCSTLALDVGARRHGALLTPQGKIQVDLILERTNEGFLLDLPRSAADAFLKRLQLYRLRAKVEIAARDDLAVVAFAGGPDPRSPAMPARSFVAASENQGTDVRPYHAMRIAACIAEGDCDFNADEVFAADVNLDLTAGVDFSKGCFVGQEVASRMKRRGTARRRALTADLGDNLDAQGRIAVLAGDDEVGSLTSVAGRLALVRIRIDRVDEAERAGAALTCGGVSLSLRKPEWLAGEMAALRKGAATQQA